MSHRTRTDPRTHEELLRAVLKEAGRLKREEPTLALYRNDVGDGFKYSALGALKAGLAEFGNDVVVRCEAILQCHRISYGLAVGSEDLPGSLRGRWLGVEIKTEHDVLSPDQVAWHEASHAHGRFVTVIRDPAELRSAVERCLAGDLK